MIDAALKDHDIDLAKPYDRRQRSRVELGPGVGRQNLVKTGYGEGQLAARGGSIPAAAHTDNLCHVSWILTRS